MEDCRGQKEVSIINFDPNPVVNPTRKIKTTTKQKKMKRRMRTMKKKGTISVRYHR